MGNPFPTFKPEPSISRFEKEFSSYGYFPQVNYVDLPVSDTLVIRKGND